MATFSNFSQTYIELSNFNQAPHTVKFSADGKSTIIAQEGLVFSQLDIDANFRVDSFPPFAYISANSEVYGTATRYLSDVQFFPTLTGKFSLLAGEFLKFDFQGFLNVTNSTTNLLTNSLSNIGEINLLMRDTATQEIIDIFQVSGKLNTNLVNQFNQDTFLFKPAKDATIYTSQESLVLQETQETIQAFFVGSFEKQFTKDTEVELIIATQSCNFASNTLGSCEQIPEPGNTLLVMVFFSGLIGHHILEKLANYLKKIIDYKVDD